MSATPIPLNLIRDGQHNQEWDQSQKLYHHNYDFSDHPPMTLIPAASPIVVAAHVELLHGFLARRIAIVDRIAQLLNCQKQSLDYQQDQALLSQRFQDCFFMQADLASEQMRLRDQLELAHWASGFQPRAQPGNDIIDPAALLVRGLHMWRQTRWPGQKGRLRYAHTLFNVYLLRCLTLLSLRLWDADASGAGARLVQLQGVLDQLWLGTPVDQPVLVRDVRWLLPVAMSPTTDQLAGYFEVAARIDAGLPHTDRVAIQMAAVQTGGGHLRAQLHHLCVQKDVALDEHSLVLLTRVSNALDIALLLQGLVTLLRAYESAIGSGDEQQRRRLAAAIGQGLSPDPELFVNRLELLGPYTMIEHLFIATDAQGHTGYTASGQRHMQLLQDYRLLLGRLAPPLLADCQYSQPPADGYSPYGALYGFASNLLELMAFKTLQPEAVSHFSLEDVFTVGDAAKRAWVNSWRQLPHIKPDVIKQFVYPAQFADAIHARIAQALQRCVEAAQANSVGATGRLFIVCADAAAAATLAQMPALPRRYLLSSDPQRVAAHEAEFKHQADLLYCRLEGEFVVSYPSAGGWVGISKDLLTEVVGAGGDVKLAGLPVEAVKVLELMCTELVVRPGSSTTDAGGGVLP